MTDIIIEYTLEQAIADGVLVEIFKPRWNQLSSGKPIVATEGVFQAFTQAALLEIWNEYVHWRNTIKATLPAEEQLFTTKMNDCKIWLIEDGVAFTILFPEEY